VWLQPGRAPCPAASTTAAAAAAATHSLQEPFLAVVVDPVRTMASGKVRGGA
jgi:hypothetical protein